jgi:hypothetical protein
MESLERNETAVECGIELEITPAEIRRILTWFGFSNGHAVLDDGDLRIAERLGEVYLTLLHLRCRR